MSSEDRSAEDATGTESPARPLERPRNASEPGELPKVVLGPKKPARKRAVGRPDGVPGGAKGKGAKRGWRDRREVSNEVGDGSGAAGVVAESTGPTLGIGNATVTVQRVREKYPGLARWADLIAAGDTELVAALTCEQEGLATWGQLRSLCERDRDCDAVRIVAHELCAQRYLREVERLGREGIAREVGEEGKPLTKQDARVLGTRIGALQWLLSTKDRKRWGADKGGEPAQAQAPQVTVVLADARDLARDVDGDPPAILPASPEAARRLRR